MQKGDNFSRPTMAPGGAEKRTVDGIDPTFEVASFYDKIQGGARRTEGDHFHINPTVGDRCKTPGGNTLTVLNAVTDNSDEGDILQTVDFAKRARTDAHQGLTGRFHVALGQQETDAGLGGDNGLDIDALVGNTGGYFAQNTRSGTDA